MARVVHCSYCNASMQLKVVGGVTHFCSNRCKAAYWHEHDRETTWLLMELTRHLWDFRGKEIVLGFPGDLAFKPRALPEREAYRDEFNNLGEWVRGLRDGHQRTAEPQS